MTAETPEEAAFFPDSGSAWKRLEPIVEAGFTTLTFEPQKGKPSPPKGVLTLPVHRKEGAETRTFYIEITNGD